MALSKEEILDAIAEMSVIDIVDLIEAMEENGIVSPMNSNGSREVL